MNMPRPISAPPAEERAVLLLLYAPGSNGGLGEPVLGKTRLMKEVFLMDHEGKSAEPLVHVGPFIAYRYGPYSARVASAVTDLINAGLIAKTGDEFESWFKLTTEGIAEAARIWAQLPSDAKRDVFAVKARYNSQPLPELLQYVYTRYPEYAVASEIREKLVGGA